MDTISAQSVVVGVDGSAASDVATRWAARLAQAQHRPLMLVCAAGEPTPAALLRDVHVARQALRIQARRATDHAFGVVRTAAPDLDVTATTPMCDPRAALLDLSERVWLVAVGTRGRGRVASLLLGSVSAAVSGHAGCPVAVVRPVTAADEPVPAPVVVGIDGTDESTDALDLAFGLASTEGRALHVVHNVSLRQLRVAGTSYADQLDAADQHDRAMGIALGGYGERFPDVVVHRHLPRSGPVETLRVLSESAWLVVVGARPHPGPPGLAGLTGSVSQAVAEQASCPVVVVRARD
ncbi:MAG: universal stress protein [Nocardioidaceae bacterium]